MSHRDDFDTRQQRRFLHVESRDKDAFEAPIARQRRHPVGYAAHVPHRAVERQFAHLRPARLRAPAPPTACSDATRLRRAQRDWQIVGRADLAQIGGREAAGRDAVGGAVASAVRCF